MDNFVQQVRRIQKMPLKDAVMTIRLLCRQAYEEGIREGEKDFDDAIIIETDEQTATKIIGELNDAT